MIKLLLCGFIAGIISVIFNSVVLGLIVGIILLTIFACVNTKTVANKLRVIAEISAESR